MLRNKNRNTSECKMNEHISNRKSIKMEDILWISFTDAVRKNNFGID